MSIPQSPQSQVPRPQVPRPQVSRPPSRQLDQLNSTALKWASDGELSEPDFERIMARLVAVDPALQAIHH